jgi:hypothetical protein
LKLPLPYITPNKWYHRLYNNYCLKRLDANRALFTDESPISNEKPLFVTGFFRSGTSLTTRILNVLGMDLGPEQHLLQAKNERAVLNPNGFFENYLFMEMSLFAFSKLDSWGHLPPAPSAVEKLSFDEKDRAFFAEYTICGVHDDRISNKNKMEALKKYDLLSLNTYLKKEFKAPYAIKNPHFSVLTPFLLKKWPDAKFLVCFREPLDAIASAARITPLLNEKVYERYYSDLAKLPADKVVFFSHAKLMNSPESSLKALIKTYGLKEERLQEALKLIDPNLHRYQSKPGSSHKEVNDLYLFMSEKAINK